MYIDRQNQVSDAQTITTGSENGILSTDKIDLSQTGRNIAAGQPMHAVIDIATTMEGPSTDVLHVDLLTSDEATLANSTTVQRLGTFADNSVAGSRIIVRLPYADYKRYIGLKYTADNDALTAGAVTAYLAIDVDSVKAYASGFEVSK
jgi:hypothetical protein